jgi:hypothetical protein
MVMIELVVRAQSARAVPLIRIALWKSHDAKHKSKAFYSPTHGHFCQKPGLSLRDSGHLIFQRIRFICNITVFEKFRLLLVDNSREWMQLKCTPK